jgi:uncharacterized ferritin-like protein (DUF455 family)
VIDSFPLVFGEPDPRLKISNLERAMHFARAGRGETPPEEVARSTQIVGIRELPTRGGLSTVAGLSRVLHDLANIEMQAIELGLRTLIEFPTAPMEFITELEEITREEATHLELCLGGLEELGTPWGVWPVHIQLWKSTSATDRLLDRILIVHRYQEGGGLEAGGNLLRKLTGVGSLEPGVRNAADIVRRCVQKIFDDELSHVQFGSRWYARIFQGAEDQLAPTSEGDFILRLKYLMGKMPVRRERMDRELRSQAGFTKAEVDALSAVQASPDPENSKS